MTSPAASPSGSAHAVHDQLEQASRKIMADVIAGIAPEQRIASTEVFNALVAAMAVDGGRWAELQQSYYQRHLELWMKVLGRQPPAEPAPDQAVATAAADRRFTAAEWQQLPFFDYLRQSYLLNSSWLTDVVEATHVDKPTKEKLRFYARQLIDAAAPANFPATNPEVLKLAAQTNGESLLRGLEHLSEDVKKGRITTTDESAFEIGRNIALAPGSVVFQNELFQLIQYSPATDHVYERPLVMVPPFINKYYILDLQPENSFVSFAVAQGHTVFMVSWRNAPEDMREVTWDEYLADGALKAIDVARDICGAGQANVLGFCVGGTLLSSALAVARAKDQQPAASLTLLTTMLDFSDTGDLGVYVDEAYVKQKENQFAKGGVLHGRELAQSFSSLRPNDLIWNYVVNNYLKGLKPAAFDLLYWNSDSTNLPGAMFTYYIRNTYLENNLRVPGRLQMCGVPVDLGRIDVPAYVLASREDHIVPWKTAYQSTHLLGGTSQFVLAASGHIAGVINPAGKNKRHYWANPESSPREPEDWLAGAAQHKGSWWTHWGAWLADYAGDLIPARARDGNRDYPVLEPAPGRYVRERSA